MPWPSRAPHCPTGRAGLVERAAGPATLDLEGLRGGRSRTLEKHQLLVADRHAIEMLDRGRARDRLPVDLHTVAAAQILHHDAGAVDAKERVSA
ncbi:MAG: hypothetical protein R3B99_08950 [Polyangiales bacterium]